MTDEEICLGYLKASKEIGDRVSAGLADGTYAAALRSLVVRDIVVADAVESITYVDSDGKSVTSGG